MSGIISQIGASKPRFRAGHQVCFVIQSVDAYYVCHGSVIHVIPDNDVFISGFGGSESFRSFAKFNHNGERIESHDCTRIFEKMGTQRRSESAVFATGNEAVEFLTKNHPQSLYPAIQVGEDDPDVAGPQP